MHADLNVQRSGGRRRSLHQLLKDRDLESLHHQGRTSPDLPIGVAPNLHVSLVLLPEECRGLLHNPRRFWRKELRLKAMSLMLRYESRTGVPQKVARLDAQS